VPEPLATQLQVLLWHAEKGGQLKLKLPIEKQGRASIRLVALHRPDGGTVRVLLDGKPLKVADGSDVVRLRSQHAPRVLNVHFEPADLQTGSREITIECVEPGAVGLDYVWLK
jgi:hypothetical protein